MCNPRRRQGRRTTGSGDSGQSIADPECQGPVLSKLPSVDRQLRSGCRPWPPASVLTLTATKRPLSRATGAAANGSCSRRSCRSLVTRRFTQPVTASVLLELEVPTHSRRWRTLRRLTGFLRKPPVGAACRTRSPRTAVVEERPFAAVEQNTLETLDRQSRLRAVAHNGLQDPRRPPPASMPPPN